MQHLVYNVKSSVVAINFSLLAITLYSPLITTVVYNDTKFSVSIKMFYSSSTLIYFREGQLRLNKWDGKLWKGA
jgi:hypothetical protein